MHTKRFLEHALNHGKINLFFLGDSFFFFFFFTTTKNPISAFSFSLFFKKKEKENTF